jgi:hypothetical protein
LHDDGRHDHRLADLVVEQHVHVIRVDHLQGDAEKGREREQHVAGKPAVRGVHAHLAANLEPLADDVREVVQNLGKIAARFSLDEDRGREESHVEQRHAQREIVERFLHREAEILLFERRAEFGANRFGHLVGHHLHTGAERVSGAN